jgi:hypothetical protein
MDSNPYQASRILADEHRSMNKPVGSNVATGLLVCLLPAINEAFVFWGHTEWIFWNLRHMLPLGLKLWATGLAINLTLFGIAAITKMDVGFPWKTSIFVASIPFLAFLVLCFIGHRAYYYETYAWFAIVSLQIACIATYGTSRIGKLLVCIASVTGFGLYLFHMMISSLVT